MIVNKIKKSFQQIDLHIVMLLSMILALFLAVIPTILLKTPIDIESQKNVISFVMSLPLFLVPQGIILTRVLKFKSWRVSIEEKEYFWVNELLTFYFIMISWVYVVFNGWVALAMSIGLFLFLDWIGRLKC